MSAAPSIPPASVEVVPINSSPAHIVHHLMPVIDVSTMKQRRDLIIDFTRSIMIPNIDYGTIPGTAKPCLMKPGAEKLVSAFGLTPRIIAKEQILDWTGADHGGEPFFYFAYTFDLVRDGRVLGTGEGSCNSWETKYRYRWVPEAEVPAHLNKSTLQKRESSEWVFRFSLEKAETTGQYGKPQEYWDRFSEAIANGTAVLDKKKTKSGKELDAWVIPSVAYRIPNPDVADQVNTIMKMAEKRAYIQAVLMAVGASEFYTQDLDDIYGGTIIEVPTEPHPGPDVEPAHPATTQPQLAPTPAKPAPSAPPRTATAIPMRPKAESAPPTQPPPVPSEKPAAPSGSIAELNQMRQDFSSALINAGLVENEKKNAQGIALNEYLRGFFNIPMGVKLPNNLPYFVAMKAIHPRLAEVAPALVSDARAVGVSIRTPQWQVLVTELAQRRGITEMDLLDHFEKVGVTARESADETEAYALLAYYSKSARLAVSDKFTLPAAVAALERQFGPLWPLRPEIAPEVEVALTNFCTAPTK